MTARRSKSRPVRSAGVAASLVVGLLLLAACGDNGSAKSIEVTTSNGQLSVSLDGKLPPNWPSDVPLPVGATPAGSASLVGPSNGIKAGVYRSSRSPQQVYDYYGTNTSITTTSKAAVGSGSKFVGRVSITAPITANITIVPYHQHGSLIVIVIPGGQGSSTTSTTIAAGSTGP